MVAIRLNRRRQCITFLQYLSILSFCLCFKFIYFAWVRSVDQVSLNLRLTFCQFFLNVHLVTWCISFDSYLYSHSSSSTFWLAKLVHSPTLSQRVCLFIRAWPCTRSEVLRSEVQLPAKIQASILLRSANEWQRLKTVGDCCLKNCGSLTQSFFYRYALCYVAFHILLLSAAITGKHYLFTSDGAKAIGIKTKAKAVVHKVKAKDKVINRDQGLRQGHDEPRQYHFLWRKYLPVTNSVY